MAPAAGLHFSRELLKRLEIKGVERGFLTLHSGQGNFKEIDVEDLTKHRMDSEEMIVDETLVDMVNEAKDNDKTFASWYKCSASRWQSCVHERPFDAL